MPQMQGNALEISLDFQFGPNPAIFSAHAPEITICVLFDCDTTTTRLRRKIDMLIFARVESHRKEAGARDTS